METFFFAVPIRLLWDNWEKFNGAQDSPGDSTDYTVPIIDVRDSSGHGFIEGSLSDYFGLPINTKPLKVSALWHRAYNLIWNEWFRDQNLQEPAYHTTSDAATTNYNLVYPLRKRGKRHDYFTSCLPFPQKGDPVHVPISGLAPIEGLGTLMASNDTSEFPLVNETGATSQGDTVSYAQGYNVQRTAGTVMRAKDTSGNGAYVPDVYANLAAATSVTINELREAFQIQRLLERDARGGTRYIEIIKSHFGVTSPDARLQRPEYLGGGSSHVNINPIASTVPTATSPTEPQGTLAGVGTSSLYNHGFTKSFTEHCVLIGLISVRADLTYQQGLNRMFSRCLLYTSPSPRD